MNAHRPLQQKQQTPAVQLEAFGRLLEAMDNADAPVVARQYRQAAMKAQEILRATEDLLPLHRVCSKTQALRDLLLNEKMTRAVNEGTMRWAHTFKF